MDPIEANPIANAELGLRGSVRRTTTTAATGIDAYAIQIHTNTVFSVLTDAQSSGDALTGITIPPQVLHGNFTAFTLTSGAVTAFLK